MTRTLTLLVLGITAFSGIAIARADEAITARVADGKPWEVVGTGMPSMRMTLNPDGSGKMKAGIMSKSISWTAEGSAICLGGMPGGKKCLTLTPSEAGFAGRGSDGKSMTLTRG